jgi:NAD(P)-dependent dehydrogenase (short-subunit alcohol dehydrogenase family)
MNEFAGKVVMITGASSGIGKGIAQRFYEEGALLALCSRSRERVDEAARSYAILPNSNIFTMSCDVSRTNDIRAFTTATLKRYGKIDILINNAGLSFPTPSTEFTEEHWDTTLDVNLKGCFFLSQEVVNCWMMPNGGGVIVNIGSVNSVTIVIGQACYAASKAGMSQMTRSLGREWARNGIRVNCVAPGSIPAKCNEMMYSNENVLRAMCEKIPMGRRGRVDEIADAVCYLASDKSSYITGQTLFVDGGLTLIQG